MPPDPRLRYEDVAVDLIRAVRGRRSQVAFSKRLGYQSNIAQRWEIRQCWPTAATFLHRGVTQCHIESMILPVEGTLTTADGLLDEAFAVELRTESLEDLEVGDQVGAGDLAGELATQAPGLARIEWRLGVTETAARFEVFVVTEDAGGRVVSQPAEGGRNPDGHSWGVEADLDQARE